jgi:hypothetical protein
LLQTIPQSKAHLVREEFGGALQIGNQPAMDWSEFEGGASNPIGKAGAVDALMAVYLGLVVKRQVLLIFAN